MRLAAIDATKWLCGQYDRHQKTLWPLEQALVPWLKAMLLARPRKLIHVNPTKGRGSQTRQDNPTPSHWAFETAPEIQARDNTSCPHAADPVESGFCPSLADLRVHTHAFESALPWKIMWPRRWPRENLTSPTVWGQQKNNPPIAKSGGQKKSLPYPKWQLGKSILLWWSQLHIAGVQEDVGPGGSCLKAPKLTCTPGGTHPSPKKGSLLHEGGRTTHKPCLIPWDPHKL